MSLKVVRGKEGGLRCDIESTASDFRALRSAGSIIRRFKDSVGAERVPERLRLKKQTGVT